MAYAPTNWIDGVTPVSAANLNNLEGGVNDLTDTVDTLNSSLAYFKTYRIAASGFDFLSALQSIWDNIPTTTAFSVVFNMGQIAAGFGYKYNSSYGAMILLTYSSSTNTQYWRLNNGTWTQKTITLE